MGFCESGHSSFRNGQYYLEGVSLFLRFSDNTNKAWKTLLIVLIEFGFFSSHMWLKYTWFDGLVCADDMWGPHVTSQQNYVSSWLPSLLLQSFPVMSKLQFIFFLIFYPHTPLKEQLCYMLFCIYAFKPEYVNFIPGKSKDAIAIYGAYSLSHF